MEEKRWRVIKVGSTHRAYGPSAKACSLWLQTTLFEIVALVLGLQQRQLPHYHDATSGVTRARMQNQKSG